MTVRVVYPDELKQEIQAYADKGHMGKFAYLANLPTNLEQGSIAVFHALDNASYTYSGDKNTDAIELASFFDKSGNMLPSGEIEALVKKAASENEAQTAKYAKRIELMGRVADVWVEQQGYQKDSINGLPTLAGPDGESLSAIANRRPVDSSLNFHAS